MGWERLDGIGMAEDRTTIPSAHCAEKSMHDTAKESEGTSEDEAVDDVPGEPDVTAFKRRARAHQNQWRIGRGYPIGTHPMRPKQGKPSRPLGSRIEISFAERTRSNFLGEPVRHAVEYRLAHPEPHQMINKDRLFCDLLSSMPMCFNLFGWLHDDHGDMKAANQAVHRWWPDAPGKVSAVRFEWSPGRLDDDFLGNRSAFDVAFELSLDDGSYGVIGVETKYHEHAKPEQAPNEERLTRYEEVTAESGIFLPNASQALIGTDLQQIWQDHLLALSMLKHPSKQWQWARFVLIHPSGNPSFARAGARYGALLTNTASFQVRTIESMLDSEALPSDAIKVFKERYLC